ncbi:hypothetical protein SESBI_37591 [Sesbania bispinosa]|nr:hypothetical protein SESBI_37591 [Sesbania bispinosa]
MKRCSATKSSSSSSISRRSSCACGDELILRKSNSTRNPGRMLLEVSQLGCRKSLPVIFRWADDSVTEAMGFQVRSSR